MKKVSFLPHPPSKSCVRNNKQETLMRWDVGEAVKMLRNQRVYYGMWYTSQTLWHWFRKAIINIPNSISPQETT